MSEDWLKKWYRDNFSRSSATDLKEETWKNIESQLGDWTGYWYKSNAESVGEQAPDAVWTQLSSSVQETFMLRRARKWAIARTLGLCFVFLSVPYFMSDYLLSKEELLRPSGYSIATAEQESLSSPEGLVVSNDEISNTAAIPQENILATNSNSEPLTISANTSTILPTEIPFEASSAVRTHQNINNEDKSSERVLGNIHPLATNELQPISNAVDLQLVNSEYNRKPMRARNWQVGLAGNYQRSMLLNPTLQRGNDSQSSIKNILGNNVSATISLSRKITPLNKIRLAAKINDVKSQHFMDFAGAQYIRKSLSITYQTLGLSYRRSLLPNHRQSRFGLELGAGFYGSYRTSIEESWGDEERFVMSQGFKKFDLGAQIELDGVYTLYPSVDLTLGVYYSNGFINIFDGIDGIPSDFYKTYTSAFGASIGLQYAF